MAESESAFQKSVIDLAHLHGWFVWHQRPARTARGWRSTGIGRKGSPDLRLARNGVTINAELKSETGVATPEQMEWLWHCGTTGRLWRPSDWDEILEELSAPAGPQWDAVPPIEPPADEPGTTPDGYVIGQPCCSANCRKRVPAEWPYNFCPDCCNGLASCPHGNNPADCNQCFVEGDLAYDSQRENGRR